MDETPVHRVLREAFANCLINADFYQSRGIVIIKDAHHIVFENPGNIRPGKAQMIKGGISDPRNKALMKMFNLIGIGERAGSGVPDLFEIWHQYADDLPAVEEQFVPDRTIVSLSLDRLFLNPTQSATQSRPTPTQSATQSRLTPTQSPTQVSSTPSQVLTDQEVRVVEILRVHPKYSRADIANALGWKRDLVGYYLQRLKTKGVIERMGSNRKGYWVVKL